jgi:hypothetical protein
LLYKNTLADFESFLFQKIHPDAQQAERLIQSILEQLHHCRLEIYLVDFPLYVATYQFDSYLVVIQHLAKRSSKESPITFMQEEEKFYHQYQQQFDELVRDYSRKFHLLE